MKLGELAEVFEGVATTPANLDSAIGEPHFLIQCHDLIDGKVAPRRRLKGIFLDIATLASRIPIRIGDILVALAGAEVAVVLVKTALVWCVPDVDVAVVRADSEESRLRIFDYLRSSECRILLKSRQRGKVVNRLFARDLRDLELPFA